jgi:hypothetical protein
VRRLLVALAACAWSVISQAQDALQAFETVKQVL